MYILKVRRLPNSKDLSDMMKVEIISLSVTFIYEFENNRSIFQKQFIDLTKLEALMSWKMPLFEGQLLILCKLHRR